MKNAFTRLDPRLRWLILFLPSACAVWYLQVVRPAEWSDWLNMVAVVQLVLGEFARRRLFDTAMGVSGIAGWPWALAALVVLQTNQWIFAIHGIGDFDPFLDPLLRLLQFVILVGYVEELWFRGLWFHGARNRITFANLLVGSLLFGLYHWPHGVRTVIFTTAVGLIFAAARAGGAPILALGLAHGLMNWLNLVAFPAMQLRFETPAMLVGFPLLCAVAAGLLFYGKNVKQLQSDTVSSRRDP